MFDLDGTLINSVPIYYEIIDIIFDRLGIPTVPRKTLLDAMDDGDFDWDFVLPGNMKSRKTELSEKAREIIDEIAPPMFRNKIRLIPGTESILSELVENGTKLGLVTSTPAQQMVNKMLPLRNAGLEKLLEVVITADDVINKKPAPEPLLKCSQILDISPEKCVYVGDTRVDIRAGNAAGMATIGVLTGFDDYDALNNENPDAVIKSVAQLNVAIGNL